jgi:hypothetical protein
LDVEAFSGWLRRGGASELDITAARTHAAELARHPSLSAALRDAEDRRAAPADIAALRRTAGQIAQFESGEQPPRAAPESSGFDIVRDDRPARREGRATNAPAMLPRRAGCDCRSRSDVYIDNDFGVLGKALGGAGGVGGFILVRFVGILGAAAIALGLAGTGGLITTISICVRCEGCRRRVTDLDADERRDLLKGRSLTMLVTIGLLAGAAVCGYLWWTLVSSRYGRH